MSALLVIGAHLDECEYGAGGISRKFAKLGWEVVFLNTVGRGYDVTIFGGDREKERAFLRQAEEAAGVLGARKVILRYPDKRFPENDLQAVSDIAKVVKEVNPEVVLIQWVKDHHHDHVRTARASLEALTHVNLFAGGEPIKLNLKEVYAYEAGIAQTTDFEPDFYVDIAEEIEEVFSSFRKFEALGEEPLVEQKKVQARYRGMQSGFKYAEAFKFIGPRAPLRSILPELLGEALRPAGSMLYPWGGKDYL